LVISLITCTITRQFPLVKNSKSYFFKKEKKSFLLLPFFAKIPNTYYLKETLLLKVQSLDFYIYQKRNVLYAYKGLIGRISPILVHVSLLIILGGSSFSAFKNFKAQEFLPKGEIFRIQNLIKIGPFTSLPNITTRVNDFWIEYKNNKVHQFYSNLSILDNYGNELKEQTISVNNPCRYKNYDFYQSDWNLVGIRIKKFEDSKFYEYPLYSLPSKGSSKIWVTWIKNGSNNYTFIFDQLQNTFLVYDQKGQFLFQNSINNPLFNNILIVEVLPSTGLLIKYDPSISTIYLGFAGLMLTTILSYLPYTQLWIVNQSKNSWIASTTNRGKIQLEVDFENLLRYVENVRTQKQLIKK
jgi:cytochrome c biogenesis protein